MRLVIVRHGKAKQDSDDGTDFSRDLRGRGERQAAYLGEWLARQGPGQDGAVSRIIASRAVRARRTAEIIGGIVGVEVEHHDALLVDEPASGVMELLGEWAGAVPSGGTLVLVGHNPQVSVLAGTLGGRGVGAGLGLRTGQAAVLEIPADGSGAGSLVEVVRLEEE